MIRSSPNSIYNYYRSVVLLKSTNFEMGDGRWEMGDGRWEMGDGNKFVAKTTNN
jgi:hypothetical protein